MRLRKWAYSPLPRSLRSSFITMLEFLSGSFGRSSEIFRSEKRSLSPAYLIFRYASSMLMFRDFPNLRGRVKSMTSDESFRTMSISGVLST